MRFNELMDQLHLDSKSSIEQKFEVIQRWCNQNISTDLIFTGEILASYENYRKLAEYYLDDVLPRLPENLSENSEAFDGHTAIQFSAETGFDRMLVSLSPDKAAINKPDINLMSPLHTAAVEGHYHTVKTLCDLKADLKSINKNRQTPIFSALLLPIDYDDELKARKLMIFELLKMLAPESLIHQDISGNSVLHLIATYGFSSLIQDVLQSAPELYTIKNNHSHYPIHTAILNNQFDCLKIFLTIKNSQNLVDASGRTALHYAALHSPTEVVSSCCHVFENINVRDNQGKTPLMLAAEAGNIEAMQALISNGADPELTDNDANTILHHAANFESIGSIAWVLKYIPSLNINAQNNYGQTALIICEDHRQINKIDLLLKHGATNHSTPGSKNE